MTPENREIRLSLGFLPPRIAKLVPPLKSRHWLIVGMLTCWACVLGIALSVNAGWL
jgi:hypothetical protein